MTEPAEEKKEPISRRTIWRRAFVPLLTAYLLWVGVLIVLNLST